VTDFGFGKVQAMLAQSMIISGSLACAGGGNIAGTVQYMSPQQQAGEEADPRDDLYAVGVIACELLTGSRPQAVGVTKMLERAGAEIAFAPLLEKALEQDRDDRYPSAAEMREALDRFGAPPASGGQSAQSQPPTALRGSMGAPAPFPHCAASPDLPAVGFVWTHIGTGMKFAYIPAGEFVMGSPADEIGRDSNETRHRVKLTRAFMMTTTPVTQSQWKAVMGENPSFFKADDLPVENVSWDDAVAYCQMLCEQEGKQYRLPTEAEWEYACRAGTTTAYYTGDGEAALDVAGWYHANSEERTQPVGQKKSNAWGLCDVHGNVWQWCNDCFADYPAGDVSDPKGPPEGSSRVLRGGAWVSSPHFCRSANRGWNSPHTRHYRLGFRVVLNL
jgi:formylglycine-generating enzyme required for sulfatase activity